MQPFTFFISYRRKGTAPIALLLKHEIEKRLQFVRVFVDVENLQEGGIFPDGIKRMIAHAHATIAIIGKEWMPKREKDQVDWVVEELVYSEQTPIDQEEADRYGLTNRAVLPLFVDCDVNFEQFDIGPELLSFSQRNAMQINYAGWPTQIGALVEGIAMAVCSELKKRPEKDEFPVPDAKIARTQPLADQELRTILKFDDYAGWYVDNFGDNEVRYLVKTFKFNDFNEAADFMKAVSDHCRVFGHHPEWRNVFNYVTVSLSTWDAKRRVTIYDMALALYMNKVADAVRAR
jgi:4a-hydroxytetrahydrobiopterin dehydratase